MNISLTTAMPNQEVIITDSGGKKILDTIPPYPATLTAALPTAQTLLDLSLVVYDTPEARYEITTYKAVNPSKWTTLASGLATGPNFPSLNATANAAVVYKNTPLNAVGSFYLDDYIQGIEPYNQTPVGGYLDLTYPEYKPGNPVYLLFPLTGLYNLHVPQTPTDTVDLSTMATATMVNFPETAIVLRFFRRE
jgi:hypothetical protein